MGCGLRSFYRPCSLRGRSSIDDASHAAASPRADEQKGNVTMANGTVKWFNTDKGYGFIQPEGGARDVFVHISALERSGLRSLEDGQKVSYELERDRQGRESAANLVLA